MIICLCIREVDSTFAFANRFVQTANIDRSVWKNLCRLKLGSVTLERFGLALDSGYVWDWTSDLRMSDSRGSPPGSGRMRGHDNGGSDGSGSRRHSEAHNFPRHSSQGIPMATAGCGGDRADTGWGGVVSVSGDIRRIPIWNMKYNEIPDTAMTWWWYFEPSSQEMPQRFKNFLLKSFDMPVPVEAWSSVCLNLECRLVLGIMWYCLVIMVTWSWSWWSRPWWWLYNYIYIIVFVDDAAAGGGGNVVAMVMMVWWSQLQPSSRWDQPFAHLSHGSPAGGGPRGSSLLSALATAGAAKAT